MPAEELRAEEVTELLNAIKQRVRARYPSANTPLDVPGSKPVLIPLPDLMRVVYARDAAQAKVAAIGSVNPRAGGPLNSIIQMVKRTVARSLSWFVRDQVVFNRQVMACIESIIETLNETNFALSTAATGVNAALQGASLDTATRLNEFAAQVPKATEVHDLRAHWQEWRAHWERSLALNEMQFLRSAADLQMAFSHRTAMMENSFRDLAQGQHEDFKSALDRRTLDIQTRLWADLEKVRLEYDRLIHSELRVVRQRLASGIPVKPNAPEAEPNQPALGFDYQRFQERFRGSEEYVRSNQQLYLPMFREAGRVLDVGCGRGEFLGLLRENGIPARGIESSEESVRYCRSKGLDVERADLFQYLNGLPEALEDVIFCSQVVEHLDPLQLPHMVELCATRLRRGGLLAIETPNPECLAIFATHFYLDPTHTRPVPPSLLRFYLEESGMGGVEIHRFAPAIDSFPEIGSLPRDFAGKFFGAMDYAIVARKLT